MWVHPHLEGLHFHDIIVTCPTLFIVLTWVYNNSVVQQHVSWNVKLIFYFKPLLYNKLISRVYCFPLAAEKNAFDKRPLDQLRRLQNHVMSLIPLRKSQVYYGHAVSTMDTKMRYFEGNGGDKSLPAREGTLGKVSRGGDRDDHHQSRKVRGLPIKTWIIIMTGKR